MVGVGKYVREQLSQRIKQDNELKECYKNAGMFVEGMNEVPEIRETAPGYLIRSGETTAMDSCFGRDAGAGAVLLLLQKKYGVTVLGLDNGVVKYAKTDSVIQQRFVDLNMVAVYEAVGVCFGRSPKQVIMECQESNIHSWNYI